MILDHDEDIKIEIERPQLPIVYRWMKDEKDTNSGFSLIGVRVTSDWMDIQCPNCKKRYELTHDHIDYFKPTKWIQICMTGFVILGIYKFLQIIMFLVKLF